MFKKAEQKHSSTFPARLENLKGILDFVEQFCLNSPLSARDLKAIKLSVEEICTNIIRHSYLYDSGDINITGVKSKQALTLVISDQGSRFDPTKITETQLDDQVETERKGGLGLQLVKKLMDRVEYNYQNGENCLKLVKRYPGAKAETRPAKRASLRTKVSWAAWLTILTGVMVFFFLASRRIETGVTQRILEDTLVLVQTIARNSSSSLEIADDLALSKLVRDFAAGKEDLAYLVVVDSFETIWASAKDPLQVLSRWQSPAGLKGTFLGAQQYKDPVLGRVYYFTSPVQTGSQIIGQVYLGLKDRGITAEISQENKTVGLISLLFLAIGWVGIYLVSKAAFRPVQELRDRIQRIGGTPELKQAETGSDEIEEILKAFGQATDRIKKTQLTASEEEKLRQELAQAEQIRQALIPKETPPVRGAEIASLYKVAREIGGDYFDFVQVDDQNLGIAVADIAGKGISASMVMASVRTALRFQALDQLDPARVLDQVDSFISSDIPKGMFVTMFYAVLNLTAGKLCCASAGHNPALFYQHKEKKILRINPRGKPLGLKLSSPELGRESVSLKLAPADILVLYTDGITECRNPAGEQFGLGRLSEFVHTNSSQSAEELKNLLEQKLREFSGSAQSADDITLVIFKLIEKDGPSLTNDLNLVTFRVERGELSLADACRQLGVDYRSYRRYRARGKRYQRPLGTDMELSGELNKKIFGIVEQQPQITLSELKRRVEKGGPDRVSRLSTTGLYRRLIAIGLDNLKGRYEYILRTKTQPMPEWNEALQKLRAQERLMSQLHAAELRSRSHQGFTNSAGMDTLAADQKELEE